MSVTENIYDHCYKSKDSSLKNTALDKCTKSHKKIQFNYILSDIPFIFSTNHMLRA